MKAQDTDIQTIRLLLDKYYEGESTPDDERRLREFFVSAERSSLPDDMRADAGMMAMIEDAGDMLCRMADPLTITNAYLSAATRTADTDGDRKNGLHHKLHFLWSPAAAVIIAFITATVFCLHSPQQNCPDPNAGISSTAAAATDPYIEVDNHEEADSLLIETFSLIGKRMAFARNTMSKSKNKIDKTNLTVKSILKNEKI